MAIDESKVEKIFLCALDLGTEQELDAYLEEACDDDQALRDRVQQLLNAQPRLGSFLQQDGGQLVATRHQPLTEGPGDQIGPYKLLEVIGEGGMGTVYMAQQTEPVHRRVALKLIKTGMDTRQMIARFESERQALALMDHPNIARVLDAGATESGRPYFVMELVKGIPIIKFCDQQQMDLNDRLELFQQVCHAIQHAHQKGIIHRDIKPSNLLMAMYDDRPVPKVIDFGLAKATGEKLTEKTMFTRFGQIVGTLEYMSPEQAQFNNLDIDTRTDIYSLGTILYELLAGEPPFARERIRNQPLDETLRMIREDEPTRPSTKLSSAAQPAQVASNRNTSADKLGSVLRGDLDWIVMKALEKDRSRRYETANTFAEDVQRFLNDEPVIACPPSTAYRFRKFARRQRVALAFAVLLTLFLVTSIVSLSVSNKMLSVREKQTQVEKKKADENLELALDANQPADTHLQQLKQNNQILTSIFKDLNIDEIRASNDPLRVVLAGRLAASAGNIDAQHFTDPSEQAGMLLEIGNALLSLGFTEKACQVLKTAHSRAVSQQPQDEQIVFESLLSMESALLSMGKYQEALTLSKDILAQVDMSAATHESIAVRANKSLAANYRKLGQYNAAISASQKAISICRQANLPAELLSTARIQHAINLAAAGKYKDAMPILEDQNREYQELYGEDHPKTLGVSRVLAQLYQKFARYDDAIQIMERCADFYARELGPSHPFTVDANVGLGMLYVNSGKLNEGVALLEEGLELRAVLLSDSHPQTLATLNNLAMGYRELGKYEQAVDLLEEALLAMRRVLGPEHPTTQVCMHNLALNLKSTGNSKRAIELWRQCLDIRLVELPDHPNTLTMMKNLGVSYIRTDKAEQAVKLLETVLEKEKARSAPYLGTMTSIAGAYRELGKLDLAEQYYEETFQLAKTLESTDSEFPLAEMQNYAVWQWRQGKLDKSIPIFEKILERRQNSLPENHPKVAGAMANLGVNYKDANKLIEGVLLLEEAYELDAEHRRMPFILTQLFDAYVKVERFEDAARIVEEYLTLARSRWSSDSEEFAKALNVASQWFLIPTEDWDRAERLLREAQAIRVESRPGRREFFETQLNLGTTLLKQGKFLEAEELLLSAHQGLLKHKEKTEPRRLRVRESLERLIELYDNWPRLGGDKNSSNEADRWKKELVQYVQEDNDK